MLCQNEQQKIYKQPANYKQNPFTKLVLLNFSRIFTHKFTKQIYFVVNNKFEIKKHKEREKLRININMNLT